jgi:hypothetical protein
MGEDLHKVQEPIYIGTNRLHGQKNITCPAIPKQFRLRNGGTFEFPYSQIQLHLYDLCGFMGFNMRAEQGHITAHADHG